MNHSPRPPSRSLLDLPARALLDALASSAPAPGGGAAAALAGAAAAALVQMTANLTLGRPRFAPVDAQARRVAAAAERRRRLLEQLADADAEAYARVAEAYRLPRDTEPAQRARSGAIQAALAEAARVPLQVAQACAALLVVCEEAAPLLNPSAISDVAVGAVLAHAALESAAINVEVNLGGMTDTGVGGQLAQDLARARAGAAGRLARVLAVAGSRRPRAGA